MIKNCTKCGTPTKFGVSHNSRQGYWWPEWCLSEATEKLTFEEFVKVIKERF